MTVCSKRAVEQMRKIMGAFFRSYLRRTDRSGEGCALFSQHGKFRRKANFWLSGMAAMPRSANNRTGGCYAAA